MRYEPRGAPRLLPNAHVTGASSGDWAIPNSQTNGTLLSLASWLLCFCCPSRLSVDTQPILEHPAPEIEIFEVDWLTSAIVRESFDPQHRCTRFDLERTRNRGTRRYRIDAQIGAPQSDPTVVFKNKENVARGEIRALQLIAELFWQECDIVRNRLAIEQSDAMDFRDVGPVWQAELRRDLSRCRRDSEGHHAIDDLMPAARHRLGETLQRGDVLKRRSRLRDERAFAVHLEDQAFLLKIAERLSNRDAAHGEHGLKLTLGGHAAVRRILAVQNAGA